MQNILAAGTATLRVDGSTVKLGSPRVITSDAAWQQMPSTAKRPPDLAKVTEYLQMDVSR